MTIDFVKRINESFGMNLNVVKSLPTRKGMAFKVEENGTEMLLKVIELREGDKDTEKRTRSLRKEAKILREISDFTRNLYIDSGEVDDHFWLLRKWLHGIPASNYMSYVRSKPLLLENKRRFVKDLIEMLLKVIELYNFGYLHGDLQPGHFIIDLDGKFHLIDLELAVNVNDLDATYRGALVHYVPPETARGMLVNDQKIPLDQVSEVYSFGAVAFFIYTGVVPAAYGESMEDPSYKDFSFEDKLNAIVQGRVRSFAQAGAETFPEFERILMKCLESEKARRYQTFEELKADLEKLSRSI